MKRPRPISQARDLRQKETESEQILWSWLRNNQLNGAKFRRQQPLGNYVVDFVCFDKKLIIEIDGGQHNDDQFIEKDKERTRFLHSEGFRVIRFWNNDVLTNIDGVIIHIRRTLE